MMQGPSDRHLDPPDDETPEDFQSRIEREEEEADRAYDEQQDREMGGA